MRQSISQVRESRATWLILVAGVILLAFFVVCHGVNKELLGDGTFLALDMDNNLPSWATTALFVVAGSVYGLLAWLRLDARVQLGLLAIIALLLSLEQMAQLHMQVERDVGDSASLLIEGVLGLGFVGAIVLAASVLPRPSRLLLAGSLATIIVSFGSSELNSSFDLPYALIIFFQTLEEVTEMLTAILIIAAAAQPLIDAISERVRAEEQAAEHSAAPS